MDAKIIYVTPSGQYSIFKIDNSIFPGENIYRYVLCKKKDGDWFYFMDGRDNLEKLFAWLRKNKKINKDESYKEMENLVHRM